MADNADPDQTVTVGAVFAQNFFLNSYDYYNSVCICHSLNRNLPRFGICLGQIGILIWTFISSSKRRFFTQVISQLCISVNELAILKYENVSF